MDKNLKIKKRRAASLDARKARSGYIFVLPFILGILLVYLPILIDSIWFSFNDLIIDPNNGNPIIVLQYNNFEYYKFAFTESPDYLTTLLAGLQQLVFEVPAIIVFSLFIAVVLNQKMLGRAAFRAIFFVPVIIATGLMESLSADNMDAVNNAEGGINDGSGGSGAAGIISVLDVEAIFSNMVIGTELVTYVVQLVNNIYQIINYSGVQMLIFLAGLQSISPSIYEACQIEGATGWETFWKITFPMISPMILVNAVYTIIDSFTRSENVMMKYLTNIANQSMRTALSWIYFVVVILIIAAVAGIVSSFVFYQRKD
ncbi:MAG: sugar ABC transporter permease [Clostridia bacterium]|nr:sugar ABC transporter permease [Clostridia bacterium]